MTLSTTGSSGAGSEDDEGLITPPAGLSPRQLASRGQLRPTRLVWEEPLARSMRNSIETPMKVTLPKAIAAAEAGLFTRTASGKHVTAVVAHRYCRCHPRRRLRGLTRRSSGTTNRSGAKGCAL